MAVRLKMEPRASRFSRCAAKTGSITRSSGISTRKGSRDVSQLAMM